MRNLLRQKQLGGVNVGTVDDFQGQELRVTFISTVLSASVCPICVPCLGTPVSSLPCYTLTVSHTPHQARAAAALVPSMQQCHSHVYLCQMALGLMQHTASAEQPDGCGPRPQPGRLL